MSAALGKIDPDWPARAACKPLARLDAPR